MWINICAMRYMTLIKEMLKNNACDSVAWLSSIHKQTAILATVKHQLGFTDAFSINSLSEISNIQVDCYNSQIFGNDCFVFLSWRWESNIFTLPTRH